MPDKNASLTPVKRALISVSDKSGIEELARALTGTGAEILSTGGTARRLRDAGIQVTEVSEFTGFPEILDGRVKTLHPRIHAGLLQREGDSAVAEQELPPIDLVAINLYPFEETIAEPGATLQDAVEQIDIGGPAMLRAAAKNHQRVTVLSDPSQYAQAIEALRERGGFDDATRFRLAIAAFNLVARYDAAISNYLSGFGPDGARQRFPGQANACLVKRLDLRYGENPHQPAAFYAEPSPAPGTMARFRQHQGKSLSFNNIADSDAAWECVRQFDRPACVIVKHANPCGAAQADDPVAAYRAAFACDESSAFGGIIAFNRALEAAAVNAVLDNQFVEVLIAPEVRNEALEAAAVKKNVRVLEIPPGSGHNRHDYRRVGGGLLVQGADTEIDSRAELTVASGREPTEGEWDDLAFAWRVARFVRSNAIVCAKDGRTIGIGAGQTSRVMSVRIALQKAAEANLPPRGAALASDAFFPFRDGLDAAAEAGITAVIQPAGSLRDDEIVAAADQHGLALVFASRRHFRH